MKYNKMNKSELTALATERNITIDQKATKADIIVALVSYDADHYEEPAGEATTEQVVEGKEKVTKMSADELLAELRNVIAYPEITYKEGINARKGSIIVNDGKSRICRVSPTRKHTFTIVTADSRETVEDLSVINDMILTRRQQAAEKKAAADAKKEAKKSKKTEEPKIETTEK